MCVCVEAACISSHYKHAIIILLIYANIMERRIAIHYRAKIGSEFWAQWNSPHCHWIWGEFHFFHRSVRSEIHCTKKVAIEIHCVKKAAIEFHCGRWVCTKLKFTLQKKPRKWALKFTAPKRVGIEFQLVRRLHVRLWKWISLLRKKSGKWNSLPHVCKTRLIEFQCACG